MFTNKVLWKIDEDLRNKNVTTCVRSQSIMQAAEVPKYEFVFNARQTMTSSVVWMTTVLPQREISST